VRRILLCCVILAMGCAHPRNDAPTGATTTRPRAVSPVKLEVVDTVAMSLIKAAPGAARRIAELNAARGTLVGLITDAETGRPVSARVDAGTTGAYAIEDGLYEVIYIDPGSARVRVESLGYAPEVRTFTFSAGRVDTLNIALRRAAPVRLSLAGTWHVRFKIREPGARRSLPAQRFVEGTITFSDTLNLVDPSRPPQRDRYVWMTEGLSEIDFSPFFGSRVASDVSTTISGPQDGTFDREAVGTVTDGDSVEIGLIPRISHGGVSFAGRARGDSIVGQWVQRAYCCGAHGDFVLRRVR
jgi:hypothetical protein